MYCTNCGKKIPDGISFCTECGTRVNTEKKPAASVTRDLEQPIEPTAAPFTESPAEQATEPAAAPFIESSAEQATEPAAAPFIESAAEQATEPAATLIPEAPAAPAGDPRTAQRLREALSSPLALTVCILLSASAVFSLFGSLMLHRTVILILATIGAWLTYSSAKKNRSPEGGLKLLYGSVKAYYIIKWILIVLLLVLLIASLIILPNLIRLIPEIEVLQDGGEYYVAVDGSYYTASEFSQLMNELEEFVDVSAINDVLIGITSNVIIDTVFTVLSVVFIVYLAIEILINIFFNRPLYLMIKSVKTSFVTNENKIVMARRVRAWCIVLAILTLLGSFPTLFVILSTATLTAALYIIGAVMIKKYFR